MKYVFRFLSLDLLCLVLLPFYFAACDDSTTQATQEKLSVVTSVKDLPECTDENEGEQALVKGEAVARFCMEGKWVSVLEQMKDTVYVNEGVQKIYVSEKVSCETKKLSDGSGIKVICNDDSIGVVLNGRDGADGADGVDGLDGTNGENGKNGIDGKDGKDGVDGKDGEDGKNGTNGKDGKDGADGGTCQISNQTAFVVTIICGEDSITLNLREWSLPDSIVGFAQKGPMIAGNRVDLEQIIDEQNLKRNGALSTITDDKGRFSFPTRDLSSRYVFLWAVGGFRNEVSGDIVDGHDKMYAIADLQNQNGLNINVLTYLEYHRVSSLVKSQGLSIEQAKRKAHNEILDFFHIDGSYLADFGSMNIFGNSESDAALLAISILMVRDSSKYLMSLIHETGFFAAYLNTGKGNADSVKTMMAEWAMNADLSGRLPKIRKNMLNWKISATVPNFEKYIRNFWMKEFNVDDCSGANEGDIFVFPNEDASVRSLKCSAGEWTFHEIRDLRDSNIYRVVKMGDQIWMAENLNYLNTHDETNDSIGGSWCSPDADSCARFGRYYSWPIAMDCYGDFSDAGLGCVSGQECKPQYPVRGICPEGWHLPDTTDWEILESYVNDDYRALEATGFKGWPYATDRYGFSVLPTGFVREQGEGIVIGNVGTNMAFWTMTEVSGYTAASWDIADNRLPKFWVYDKVVLRFPIRCLKD